MVGFSYVAGIVAASFFAITPEVAVIGCVAVAIVAALISGVLRKAAVASLTMLSFAVGILGFTVYDFNSRRPVLEKAGEVVEITGIVEDKGELAFYTAVYTVNTRINGRTTRVLLTAPDDYNIEIGDAVTTEGVLYQIRDTGVFPEKTYNLSKGILLKGTVDSLTLSRKGSKTPLGYIREYNAFIKGEIMAAFPDSELNIGGLLCAVFLGDKSGLSPESAQSIRIAGVAHYTAVSGLHMTMLVHMFMLVWGLTPFRANRRAKFAVLVCVVVILAVFFNLTVSVVRAAIMLVVFYGGELFMRRGSTVNSMGFALLLILLPEPYAAFDAGLIMSFSGTFGVGVVAPALIREKKINRVAEAFVVSVCASVCVLPASALFFGGISILSPVTSVVILPFFMVAAGAMGLFSVFATLNGIGQIFLLLAGVMSKGMNSIINLFGGFKFAWISLDYWFVPFWTAFAIAAIAVIRLVYKSDLKAIKAAGITIATLALMICFYNANKVNSGRTYITIYSDSVSAWVSVKQSNTEVIVVTADTPTASAEINKRSSAETPTMVALLSSKRNNAEIFGGVTEGGVYDISGRFTLDIGENETILQIGDFSILFTRAGNDNAPPADVTVASGWVRYKRDFDSDYIVYVSRSIAPEKENEFNACYEPVYLILM